MNQSGILNIITTKAIQSLLYEAILSPKPGLVDPVSNGSHQDMTIFTFMDSSASLYPGFYSFLEAGMNHRTDGSLTDLFSSIRQIGLEIEQDMLLETNQINTHKGAIFSFGIFLTAIGKLLSQNKLTELPFSQNDINLIINTAKEMVAPTLLNDFKDLEIKTTLSHGEKLYLEHGMTGIRGLAIEGYKPVSERVLPFLRTHQHWSLESKLQYSLMLLMSSVEDSNIIYRSDMNTFLNVRHQVTLLLNDVTNEEDLAPLLRKLDEEFISLNISPGGSADLLALSIFLAKLEEII